MKAKFSTKLLSILLALVTVLSALPFSALPAVASEPESEIVEVGTWVELLNAVNSDKTQIKLKNDIEDHVPDDELPTKHRLVFNGGKEYVLDLNGYEVTVLNHANEFYTGGFSMIEVSDTSKLEIRDGSLIFDNYYAKANRKARGVIAVLDDSALTAIDVSMQNAYTGTVVYANASARVTLKNGEYAVQNGFAIYLENQASLTLNGPYVHTVMGDGTSTQYVDGYGALYSESKGELVINDAFFKSGVQVSASQIDAFSVATHEVTVNGNMLTEDIFSGTNYEAKQQNKEYYWYSWTGYSLMKTENSSFANTVRVISYERKYPVTVESGIATVGGAPVTEASYGQTVTVVAAAPEEGMEFVRWESGEAVLGDKYSASTTFIMPPRPVTLTPYYGKEAVKSVSVTVEDIIPGRPANDTEIALADGVILGAVEWREESALKGDYAVFRAGKSYTVTMLVYPPEGNKFDGTVSATVNGKNATVSATSQYAYIEYAFEATPSVGFAVVYDVAASQLGVGGKIVLDNALMASQSADFKAALDAGQVTYQWYRNGEAVQGANESAYHFSAEDATGIFYVAVTANGKSNYGHNVTCYSDLYQLYLNASDVVVGEKAPLISAATPGVSIDAESMTLYEILGDNLYGNPQKLENAILIPGKSYLLVGKIIEQDGVNVASNANVYVNGVLMKDRLDAGRFFYEFTTPEADYPVYYKANGEIGIGVTLTVDVDKMSAESGTFKHAVEVQTSNPTYRTVFYQWYRNGEEIKDATVPSYTVTTADKDSYIHCKVTLVDGKYGVGAQHGITNVITVINAKMPIPKNGEQRILSGISADGVVMSNIMWWPVETGTVMQGDATYVEGEAYEYLITFEPKDGFLLDFTEEMTVAYVNSTKITSAGSSNGAARYTGEVRAIHQHQYSDTVWHSDEYGHWQACVIPGCPDPDEGYEGYVEHWGGGATCYTIGTCTQCGADYYADHDFANVYAYRDEMTCAVRCEFEGCTETSSDWSYHEGGVFTCQQKAVCDICHHEYGNFAPCTGGTATCTEKAICDTCGEAYGETLPHDYGTEFKSDANGHWNECACKARANVATHADENGDGTCDACGYALPIPSESEPSESEPSESDPAESEPSESDPAESEPSESEPSESEPSESEPSESEPSESEPAESEPAESEPAESEPAESDPVEPDPAESEPAETDPRDPTSDSTPDGDSPDGEEEGLGAGAIVGIVVGSVSVVGIGGFALFWFVIKKKTWRDLIAVFKK